MNSLSHVPPGFRFHPTDEELVDYYLRKKITSRRIDLDVIKDIDLYKIEPWDLQELCRMGTEEQSDWYFFSHKDKKYPTGTRTNRATAAGFWKATGRDKAIYSKHDLIGMRKTLVYYKGRAPNGQKSDFIMHEYRLETDPNGAPQATAPPGCSSMPIFGNINVNRPALLTQDQHVHPTFGNNNDNQQVADQVTDWRVLDKFVASQLSQEDENNNYSSNAVPNTFQAKRDDEVNLNKQEMAPENTSTASSSSQIDLWK
ncbi:hypothetical protein KY289_027098 [Solanum tuberosum]|nr:hypothetical protein KY289_027098 [Solanum tuberosum]